MIEYQEHTPSPCFARYVECFWNIHVSGGDSPHRVLPDGCADISFSRHAGESRLILVGAITSAREFQLRRDEELFGVRFRPAMWNLFVPAPWSELTDRTAPLDDLLGNVRIEDIAAEAGLSARQLLRLFTAQTGVTPKQLCRVLRFRHSLRRLRRSTDCAQIALDCGYYDQAHWINEFRGLSGCTPGQYLARQA